VPPDGSRLEEAVTVIRAGRESGGTALPSVVRAIKGDASGIADGERSLYFEPETFLLLITAKVIATKIVAVNRMLSPTAITRDLLANFGCAWLETVAAARSFARPCRVGVEDVRKLPRTPAFTQSRQTDSLVSTGDPQCLQRIKIAFLTGTAS